MQIVQLPGIWNAPVMRYVLFFIVSIHCSYGQWPLDPNFASAGKLSLAIYDYQEVEQFKKLDDGNLLLATQAGRIIDGKYDNDVLLSKFTEEGELVTSFGTDGHFLADFPGFETSLVKDFIELPGGNILVLGYAFNFDNSAQRPVTLMLVDGDGQLITGFGVGGVLQYTPLGESNTAYSIHRDDDGKLLIAVGSNDPVDNSGTVAVLMRLTSSYELDLTFGGTGKVEVDPSAGAIPINAKTNHVSSTYFSDVITTSTGEIYAVGSSYNFYQLSYIVKLKDDGTQDSSFYSDGIYAWDPSPVYTNSALKIEALSNGDLLIPVKTSKENHNFTLLRIKDGEVTPHIYEVAGEEDFLEHVVEDAEGNVYLIGRSVNTENFNSASYANHYSIIKVLNGLTKDPTFGYDGILQFEWDGEKEAGATEALLSSTGQLILAGEVIEADKSAKTIGVVRLGESVMTALTQAEVDQKVCVYPNPFQQQFSIETAELEVEYFTLTDQAGRAVFSGSYLHTATLHQLTPGMYFLNMTIQGKVFTKKIIKAR